MTLARPFLCRDNKSVRNTFIEFWSHLLNNLVRVSMFHGHILPSSAIKEPRQYLTTVRE